MAMRTAIERSMHAQVQRLGGYGSNNFGLNSHMGRYEEFDFCDWLNDPRESPFLEKEGIHNRLEKVYGL